MIKHSKYEFVTEAFDESIKAETIEEAFEEYCGKSGFIEGRIADKATTLLKINGIDAQFDGIAGFFDLLESNGNGSWRFFNGEIGKKWKFDTQQNDVVRRLGYNPKSALNIEKSHEARRRNPELAREIARKANSMIKNHRGGTSEIKVIKSTLILKKYKENETEEQRKERISKIKNATQKYWNEKNRGILKTEDMKEYMREYMREYRRRKGKK